VSPAAFLAAALTGLLAAQGTPPAAAPARPVPPPSDAAALGFLRSVVDKRLYSLEAAGAARVRGTAQVTFDVLARGSAVKSTALELQLLCDYATGQTSAVPAAPPTESQSAILPYAVAAAQRGFSWLPSREAELWTATFASDGELLRLDYRPAPGTAGAHASLWTEWHRSDGTPVRRRVSSLRPIGEATEPIVQEIVPAFTERKGRLLLTDLKPGDPEGRFSWSFEYEEKDGFLVLKKLVQRNEGWRMTVQFSLAVERPAAR